MSLTDITNECKYVVESHHKGGVFYNIQAETKTCWQTVALMVNGELSNHIDKKGIYKVYFVKEDLKVYRIGPMTY